MNNTHIYVGDNILDIKPGQVITISVKNIEIGDLTSRFVSYSNNVKILWTENNLNALGLINSENSRSLTPYQLNTGKVIQNGIEIIPDSTLIIRNSNKKEATINIYENAYDFFKQINGLKLTDINPISDSAWNASDIDSARTNTSGIVSVLIYYGYDSNAYNSSYFLPSFYYHTLITSILEHTGLSLSGSILTDARFTDLVVPFPGDQFKYPNSLIDGSSAKGTSPGQSVGSPSIAVGVIMNLNADYGNIVAGEYIHETDYVSAYISASISVSSISWFSATLTFARIIRLRSSVETTLATSSNITSPTTSGTFIFNAGTVLLEDEDRIYVKFFSDSSSSPTVSFTVDTTSTLEIIPTTTVSRDLISWNNLWPEIDCSELIKDFFVRFGIIPKLRANTLYLKTFEEICSDRAGAIDWSAKRVNSNQDQIDFTLGYAQNNYFDYQDSDDVLQPELGRGNLEVENEVVADAKSIYQSPFANTQLKTDLNDRTFRLAYIPVYDSTSTDISHFKIEPGLRLLTSRARAGAESTVSFNGTPRSDYRIGTFVDSVQTKDTGWEYFLAQFYSALSSSLQLNKVIVKQFNLTEIDILNYDPHKMVWDGEGYYIINKISNFVPGRITSVELFKIW